MCAKVLSTFFFFLNKNFETFWHTVFTFILYFIMITFFEYQYQFEAQKKMFFPFGNPFQLHQTQDIFEIKHCDFLKKTNKKNDKITVKDEYI